MSQFLDKVIYINLDKRQDKRCLIENELDTMELDYERFSAIEQIQNGVGCLKSHLGVLKIAKERGYKNILIFEDDFYFLDSKDIFEKKIQKLFSEKVPFDVCMFAYIVHKHEQTEYSFLGRVLDGNNAAGYLVNQHFYDTLIELFEWAVPLLEKTGHHWLYANDAVWKQLQPSGKWYFFLEAIGEQREILSDHSNMVFQNRNYVR